MKQAFFCSIVHIAFDEVLSGMPYCTPFAVLSAAQWAETIFGKYSRDVCLVYFLPCQISCVKSGQKIHERWDIDQQRRGIGRIAGYELFKGAVSCGGVNPLHYFVSDLRGWRYTIRILPSAEKILLQSILTHGIRDPLQGVDTKDGIRILLNGFKRVRCAQKLGIGIVPWHSFGNDESVGILELLRISNAKSITILEQARLIDELKTVHNMCNSDIALLLEKSRAWVSMRTGIIKEMSSCVIDKIFNGKFPAYSYMYTLRQFIRMSSIKKEDIDLFVKSVSGKNLSIRDIEILAHGYFKGSDELCDQIKNGNIQWGLKQLKELSTGASDCTGIEQKVLRDLKITLKYMQQFIYISCDTRLETAPFNAQANLLTEGILKQANAFEKAVRELHDRSGQTQGNILSL